MITEIWETFSGRVFHAKNIIEHTKDVHMDKSEIFLVSHVSSFL